MTPAKLNKPVHVLKFGGTSVATPNLIRDAAKRIGQRRAADYHVVCVVSAMGDTTNELNTLARKLSSQPPRRVIGRPHV